MESEYSSRPGRGFLYTMGAIMILLGVLLAAELSPIAGHPLQPSLGGGNPTVAGGTVAMPAGVGANPQLNFQPAIAVAVIGLNNTVTFKNNDIAVHTVTATDHSFDSGDIGAGKSWTNTFSTPGNFTYYCIYHQSWMRGTIVVTRGTGGVTVNIPAGTGSNPSLNYSPNSMLLVVGVNNTVTFVNQDNTNHTVTANDQSFDSRDIQPGHSWTHTFAAGIYSFKCVYHTYMAGTITVKSP